MSAVNYLSRAERREAARHMARENKQYGKHLQLIPVPEEMQRRPGAPIEAWRSCEYLVQVFREPPPVVVRLSVTRTALVGNEWAQNIPWEELQRIKNECGYAGLDAVEVYPNAADVVNVANIRHLWVLAARLPFAWRS